MKRIKANDPAAMRFMGTMRYEEGGYDSAFEYYIKAAELGELDAHSQLGYMYMKGLVSRRTRKREFIITRRLP
jgi:TPR repeat protein